MFIELCKHEGPERGIVRTRYLKSCLLIMLNNIKLDTEYGLFLEFFGGGVPIEAAPNTVSLKGHPRNHSKRDHGYRIETSYGNPCCEYTSLIYFLNSGLRLSTASLRLTAIPIQASRIGAYLRFHNYPV